jgi:carbonic anhydrase/acetyltransferase-like protein (isoleucine patch superfamily)
MLYRLNERVPELRGEKHFIADTASVIGAVILENNVSVWFSAVLHTDPAYPSLSERMSRLVIRPCCMAAP